MSAIKGGGGGGVVVVRVCLMMTMATTMLVLLMMDRRNKRDECVCVCVCVSRRVEEYACESPSQTPGGGRMGLFKVWFVVA